MFVVVVVDFDNTINIAKFTNRDNNNKKSK